MKYFIFLLVNSFGITIYAQNISRELALEDIRYFTKTVEEVHFNPYLFINKQEYLSRVEAVERNLADSITPNELILVLYKISALLQDGHCSPYIVQPVIKNELLKEQFLPFPVIIDKQQLYISETTAVKLGLPGAGVIDSINSKAAGPLLIEMSKYFGGTRAFSAAMEEKLLPYFLFLNNIRAPFTINFSDLAGRTSTIAIEKGLVFKEALSISMPHIKTDYRFKIIENKLGFIDFMSMSGDLSLFNTFMDSCITVCKKSNISALAIDLRNNSGGNSELGDILLSYINTNDYSLMGGRKWKISRQYKEYLVASGDTGNVYLSKPDGSVWEFGDCKPQKPRFVTGNVYKKKVYFITGPFTFSSANMVADGVKQYHLAEIIGQPTGENTSDFGETYLFSLPNSRIKMQTTTSFDRGADCNNRAFAPVKPNKLINTTLADRLNGNDKELEYLLKQIR